MPIIARVNPQVREIEPLARVRNGSELINTPDLSQATGQFIRATNEIYQRHKDRADTTALMQARRELSDYELSLFDRDNADGVHGYKGKAALEAQGKLGSTLDSRIADIGSRLTPDQREKFDVIAQGARESMLGRIQTYAGNEYEQWQQADRKASLVGVVNAGVAASLDGDATVGLQRLDEALAMQEAADQADGASEAVVAYNASTVRSDYHAQVVARLLDRDYAAAQDYLATHGDQLLPEIRTRIEGVLRPLVDDGEAETIASAIVQGGNLPSTADGGVAARAPSDPVVVQTAYRDLAGKHGFTISSMQRSAADNARVDGVKNSQHLGPAATAADFDVAGKTDAEVMALMTDLRGAGFEVIDERHRKGHKPHIHAELPPGDHGTVALQRPTTLGEALAQVKARVPASQRKRVEQHVRAQWATAEADRVDGERMALERMRAKLGQAGNASLRQALGADYAEAERQGWVASLQSQLDAQRTGQLVHTDPVAYDELARLSVTDPVEFAKPATKLRIEQAADRLDTADLARLQKAWAEANDPKKAAAALHRRKVERSLINEGVATLGIAGSKKPKDREMAAAFGLAVSQSRQAFRDGNGGNDPTAEQDRLLVGSVTRRFLADPDTAARRADSYSKFSLKLDPADRATIVADLQRRGVANPTDSEIIAHAAAFMADNGAAMGDE